MAKVFIVRFDNSSSIEGVSLSRVAAFKKCVELNSHRDGNEKFRVYEMVADRYFSESEDDRSSFELVYSTRDEYHDAREKADKELTKIREASASQELQFIDELFKKNEDDDDNDDETQEEKTYREELISERDKLLEERDEIVSNFESQDWIHDDRSKSTPEVMKLIDLKNAVLKKNKEMVDYLNKKIHVLSR